MNNVKVYINNQELQGVAFAYSGCHKIYILEDEQDITKAIDAGYHIYELELLEEIYDRSCDLRFINNWKLTKTYAAQGEVATITTVIRYLN